MIQISHNPFASRHVRPGARDFLFPQEDSLTQLLERWQNQQSQGLIVGPHGTGKSSLLKVVENKLHQQNQQVLYQQLTSANNQFQLPAQSKVDALLIDGFEQLTWWQRRMLISHCRKYQLQLLATAHQSFGLPIVFETKPTLLLLKEICNQLLSSANSVWRPSEAQLRTIWEQYPGNIREGLFQLYHLYESERKLQKNPS